MAVEVVTVNGQQCGVLGGHHRCRTGLIVQQAHLPETLAGPELGHLASKLRDLHPAIDHQEELVAGFSLGRQLNIGGGVEFLSQSGQPAELPLVEPGEQAHRAEQLELLGLPYATPQRSSGERFGGRVHLTSELSQGGSLIVVHDRQGGSEQSALGELAGEPRPFLAVHLEDHGGMGERPRANQRFGIGLGVDKAQRDVTRPVVGDEPGHQFSGGITWFATGNRHQRDDDVRICAPHDRSMTERAVRRFQRCERAANASSHSVGMSTTGVRAMQMKVLGPIGVELEQPAALGGPTQRRVLAVLALHAGGVVSVDRLVDAVWPDGDAPERADHNVRTYVHRLRSALGDDGRRIETVGNGYRLHLERHELDASRFEDLVAEGRAAAALDDHDEARRCFDDALALWGGRPYDEFADEEWARAEVARLDELRASAVEHRNAALLDAGRHTEVIGELRDAATEQPWREVRRMQLALALYRSGRQAEALQVLRDYRTGLVEELGLDPSPELGRLEHRILEHDPELLPPSHRRHDLRGYRLDEVVGEGAFALVWRGVQPSLGRTVAVKQIRAELANHPDFVRRFETEAQTVAMLEHPHIVPLYDYWREPDGAYLVMRYVSGGSLESEVLHGGLDEPRLRRFVEQAGSALEAAHRMGVIHRDVKAANVLLDDNGNFYLTDFGIAFIGSAVDDELATSLSTGSPAYASPEQLRRQVLDVRTDVYGFGITLFEAATGRLPFADAPTEAALVRRQLDEPVPAPSSVEPSVPPWVDEVVARATAKNPSDRYASMAELMAAVAPGAVAPIDTRYRLGTGTVVGELVNPFKALRAFREADTADFFGRNRLVARFIEVLSQPGSAGRLLAVVGPSGSGKSSVVRSGLVPRLRRGAVTGSADWFITTMLPGSHPFDEFESALSRVAVRQPGPLVEIMRSDERGIARAVNQILPDEDSELLVVIDQFEELFTHGDDTERTAFVNGLVAALREPRARLRVVLTIRADFWDRPLRHPGLAARLEKATVTVPPLAADELEAAIVEPVHRQGASYEPGLVARIMADVRDQPGALPLLQYALTELFDANVSGLIRTESYDAIGGLTGALAMRAEQTFTAMSAGQQTAARQLFGRLVSLGEGTEDTRRRVRLGELGDDPDTEAVIDAFGDARLLVFDHEPATREPTVELAHEALIRAWPRLRTWLDEDRDGLRIHRHLTETTMAWLASGRDDGELYRGGRLEAVKEYAAGAYLTDDEQAFLDAGVAAAEAEAEAERRRVSRLRRLALALGVVAVLAIGAGFVAVGQQRRADDNAAEARAASALAETQADRANEAADDAAEQAERAEDALADAEIATLISRSAALVDENPAASLLLAAEVYDREPSNRTTAALATALVARGAETRRIALDPIEHHALRGRLRLAHGVPADLPGRMGRMARGRGADRDRPHDRRNPCPHHPTRPMRWHLLGPRRRSCRSRGRRGRARRTRAGLRGSRRAVRPRRGAPAGGGRRPPQGGTGWSQS